MNKLDDFYVKYSTPMALILLFTGFILAGGTINAGINAVDRLKQNQAANVNVYVLAHKCEHLGYVGQNNNLMFKCDNGFKLDTDMY